MPQLDVAPSLTTALQRSPELFDAGWYLHQVDEGIPRNMSALQHFLTRGRARNLAPGPWLDPEWYWETYPDVAAVQQPAFDHYTLHGEIEGRAPHPHFVPRLNLWTYPFEFDPLELTAKGWSDRTALPGVMDPDWLVVEVRAAQASEPQLASITKTRLVSAIPGTHNNPLITFAERVVDAFVEDSVLILVPHFMLGGADRVAANLATVAAELEGAGRVFVVSTDRVDGDSMHWYPPGVTLRRMQLTKENEIDDREAAKLVADLLMSGKPRVVVNINSRAGWLAFRDYGRTLHQHMALRAMLFCRDQFPEGGMGGYGDDYLRETIDFLDMVVFDNQRFRQDLMWDLGLLPADTSKSQVLYQPSSTPVRACDMELRRTDRVLWISRLVDQKRPDLVSEIAALMPSVTFEMYGGPVSTETIGRYELDQPNIRLHGPVASVDEIAALDYGALLFTSAYEGLPIVPLDFGAQGLPIVASQVGGLPELIDDQTGWLIPGEAPAEDYAAALREALDLSLGNARGRALQDRIASRHSWDAFREGVQRVGLLR